MPPEPAPREPRHRAARSFSSVALGGLGLAAVIVAVTVALYLRFVRYERIATRHVPPGAALVVRLDVQQQVLYAPVRRNLLPLLGGATVAPVDADARLARFEALTGIRRGDLREIVAALGDSPADWTVVLAGIFPRDVSAPLIGVSLAACTGDAWAITSDGRAVVGPAGTTIGRTEDGAVVVASSEAGFRAARPETGTANELGLAATGPGGFALGPAALRQIARSGFLAGDGELPAALEQLRGVAAAVTLGDRVGLAVSVIGQPTGLPGKVAERTRDVLRVFGHTQVSPAAILMRGAADRASVSPGLAGDSAILALDWEREEVDRAFVLVAETIRSRFR